MPRGSTSRTWLDLGNPMNLTIRGHIRAMGYTDYDMGRPVIGVCNPWSEINPGHVHLRTLAEAAKHGIIAQGGVPFEINTIGLCDGIAQGHEGMKRILPELAWYPCIVVVLGHLDGVFRKSLAS